MLVGPCLTLILGGSFLKMKKINPKLASGVILLVYLNILIIVSFITNINAFQKYNKYLIIILGYIISLIVAYPLSKGYDKIDNDDFPFTILLFFLIVVLVVCLLLFAKKVGF